MKSMHSLDILPLVQKDNNLQKEFRLESGQLPDQFVISTISEENTTFVSRIFCLGLFSFYLLYIPANLLWLHPFYEGILPCKHSLSGYLQIVVNNSSRKKCQTNVSLQLKLCEISRFCSMGCVHALYIGFGLHGFMPSELQVQTSHQNPLQISSFILASCWNHSKHSSLIFENKKAWLTPTFFQLYAISNSTDFSVGLILEKLNWHKVKMIKHWIRSLRLKRCIAMISVHWPLWNEYGDFSSVPICRTWSALKPPSLIQLLSAVQELCRNIVLYSIRTSLRDSVIYLRRRGHLWGHQTLQSASKSHTHKISFMHWKPFS